MHKGEPGSWVGLGHTPAAFQNSYLEDRGSSTRSWAASGEWSREVHMGVYASPCHPSGQADLWHSASPFAGLSPGCWVSVIGHKLDFSPRTCPQQTADGA